MSDKVKAPTGKSFYLTKLNPGFYELLEATSSPKKVVSKLTRTIETDGHKVVEDPVTGQMKVERIKIPKKLVMKQVSFLGTKLVGVLKWRYTLFRDLKLHVPPDTLIKLTPVQVERILKELE